MKSLITSLLVITSAFTATPIFTVEEITAQPVEALQGQEFIVRFDKDVHLPLKIEALSDAFEVSGESELTLLIKENYFIKMGANRVQISPDGIEWFSLGDYFTGTLGVEFQPLSDSTAIAFKVIANMR